MQSITQQTFRLYILEIITWVPNCTIWNIFGLHIPDELQPRNPGCLKQKTKLRELLIFRLNDLHLSSNIVKIYLSTPSPSLWALPTDLNKNQQWCAYFIANDRKRVVWVFWILWEGGWKLWGYTDKHPFPTVLSYWTLAQTQCPNAINIEGVDTHVWMT